MYIYTHIYLHKLTCPPTFIQDIPVASQVCAHDCAYTCMRACCFIFVHLHVHHKHTQNTVFVRQCTYTYSFLRECALTYVWWQRVVVSLNLWVFSAKRPLLVWASFAKETYKIIEPTICDHTITQILLYTCNCPSFHLQIQLRVFWFICACVCSLVCVLVCVCVCACVCVFFRTKINTCIYTYA